MADAPTLTAFEIASRKETIRSLRFRAKNCAERDPERAAALTTQAEQMEKKLPAEPPAAPAPKPAE